MCVLCQGEGMNVQGVCRAREQIMVFYYVLFMLRLAGVSKLFIALCRVCVVGWQGVCVMPG